MDKEIVQKEVADLLEENPFISVEKIHSHYDMMLRKFVKDNLQEYLDAESYYPMHEESYKQDLNSYLDKFFKKYGFELRNFDLQIDSPIDS